MKSMTLDELDKAYEKGRIREEIPASTLPEMQDDRITVTIEGLENNKCYSVKISEETTLQTYLKKNIERMLYLSAELRSDPKPEQASMIRELDSYLNELSDINP